MRFEILIQFIVPLMFLAIWALTSLLNRDAQPLPPRPGRPPGAGGPRPLTSMPGQTEPRSPGPGTPVQTPASSPLADPQTMWPGATSAPTAPNGQFSAPRSRIWTTPSFTSRTTPPRGARRGPLRPRDPRRRPPRDHGCRARPSNAREPGAGQAPPAALQTRAGQSPKRTGLSVTRSTSRWPCSATNRWRSRRSSRRLPRFPYRCRKHRLRRRCSRNEAPPTR